MWSTRHVKYTQQTGTWKCTSQVHITTSTGSFPFNCVLFWASTQSEHQQKNPNNNLPPGPKHSSLHGTPAVTPESRKAHSSRTHKAKGTSKCQSQNCTCTHSTGFCFRVHDATYPAPRPEKSQRVTLTQILFCSEFDADHVPNICDLPPPLGKSHCCTYRHRGRHKRNKLYGLRRKLVANGVHGFESNFALLVWERVGGSQSNFWNFVLKNRACM